MEVFSNVVMDVLIRQATLAKLVAGKLCLSLAISLLLLSFSTMRAQSGTATSNLTVQMTVTASCTISAATLNFGSSVAGTTLIASAVTANTTVSVNCTNGSPYSIGMDNGAHVTGSQRRMQSGSNYLNYGLYLDAGLVNPWTTGASSSTCTTTSQCYLGTGNGSSQSISIYGQVPAVGSAPPPGAYTDTVTMTITY